ncbi:hypothetical protein NF556_15390 [Ornithinimicrobium faecis]|uniref:Uncharacterized protein n=1 Tax=Ornithinimicrobium faecis TaxID=2934158 RepID=A0ABY4YQY8_9MICO|nr:hypothetical protein [Ornithinimicrobium sp. HY1793]USQ78996.1 hypothetical protein NF556_15390 [Ornithinimicrobium sp. HY1793]
MNTTTDLRRSLEETAQHYDAPDPHTLLRGVREDIATGRDRGKGRLVAAAAAVALVAGGGWALTQGLGSDEETGTMQPADEAWELVNGAPPEYADGLALVDTVELGATEDGAVVLEPEPVVGPSFAVAWCHGEPDDPPEPAALVGPEDGEEVVPLHCTTQDGQQGGLPEPLPDLAEGVDFGVHRAHDLSTQDVTVGIYREATVSEFPYPDQQDVPEAPEHDVMIDASSPLVERAIPATPLEEGSTGGSSGPLGHNALPGASVASHEGTTLTTWAGEPGRLLVEVNGTVITNDGEGLSQPATPGPWQDADPDLRGGYWHTWHAGATTREFDLSPAALAQHGIQVSEGESVTVTAHAAFPRDAWQVGIDQPEGVSEAADLTTVDPTEVLPAFAYGYEQVTAVSVPADGVPHTVEVGDVDPTELVWVAQCPESATMTQVQVGSQTTECSAGLEWLLAVQDAGLVTGELPEVRVAAGAEPVIVAAYAPRVWEDYPFEESTDPLAASETVAMVAPPPVDGAAPPELAGSHGPTAVYREVATVSTEDLDADGRAEVTVPSSTDLSIWLETTGASRLQLEIDGTPIDQLLPTPDQPVMPGTLQAHQLLVRDGWYSTWTTGTSGHELRLDGANSQTGEGERDEPTVTIEVEAADGAEVDLTFFEFVLEEDFEG